MSGTGNPYWDCITSAYDAQIRWWEQTAADFHEAVSELIDDKRAVQRWEDDGGAHG